jgi:hypothetical protein
MNPVEIDVSNPKEIISKSDQLMTTENSPIIPVTFIDKTKPEWAGYVLEPDAQEDLKGNLRFCVIDTNGILFFSIERYETSQTKINLILNIKFDNIIRIYYTIKSCFELGIFESGGRFIIETNNKPITFCTSNTPTFEIILIKLKKFMSEDKIIEKPYNFILSKSLTDQIKDVEERNKKSFGRKLGTAVGAMRKGIVQTASNLGDRFRRRRLQEAGGAKRKRSSKKRVRVATKKRVNKARVQSKKRKPSTKSRNYKRKHSRSKGKRTKKH